MINFIMTSRNGSYIKIQKCPIVIDINPVEKCTICKQRTVYRKKTPINCRHFYVKGCGQLCGSCYYACYNTSTVDTFLYDMYD